MELNGKPAQAADIASLALYNYGNFTTMLVMDEGVRGLELHLERLDHDARTLFDAGVDGDRVRQLVKKAIAGQKKPVIVRVTVFCKDFDLAHPPQSCTPDILVTTRQAPTEPLPPVSLEPLFYQRELPELKTTSVSGGLHRRRLAQMDGFDDALFVNEAAHVGEGPTWSIGFLSAGKVVLPEALILPSVSVALLQRALAEKNMAPKRQVIGLKDLSLMDGAFTINASNGLRGVTAIGAHAFPQAGDISNLQQIYEDIPYEPL